MSVPNRLGSMTSDELATAGPTTLLVPLGATEQHGPHLPLETDTLLATAWADGVAAALDGAVVGPALPYGSSGEHQSFPGTLSIGQDALRLALIELARSASHSFDRVVLLCGHGGNHRPVTEAVTLLLAEGHDVLSFFPMWDPPPEVGLDAHAGRTETSLLLHLAPDTVRQDLVAVGQVAPVAELMPILEAEGVAAVAQNGVLGDPTTADEEHGMWLIEALVAQTVRALRPPGSS